MPGGFPYANSNEHSPEQVTLDRNALVFLRDYFLEQGQMQWALQLERVIGHLTFYAERERRN